MEGHTTKKFAKCAISLVAALVLVGTFAAPSTAEEPTNTQEKSSPSEEQAAAGWREAPWRFNVNVYGWLPEAPADIKIDDDEVAHLPESFDTIADSLEIAAMFEVEVHKGPIGVFASPVFYEGEDNEHFKGLLGQKRKLTVDEKVWLIKYGASYDLGPWHLGKNPDSPAVVIQPYVGGLYFHDDLEMKVSRGVLDKGLDFKTTITFNTPIVGVNTLWDLTKRWYLRLGTNYGGFHMDNVKKTYEFAGLVGYRFKMWDVSSLVFAGYRFVHIDYEREVELQVDIKGPLFGIGWEF